VRKLATVGLMGLLAGTIGFAAVAGAANRVAPVRVTARVLPKHITAPPYTWTIRGKIVPPRLICPSGVMNPKYCTKPPPQACSGKVRIVVDLGKHRHLTAKKVATFTVKVKSNCTYRGTVTIPKRKMTATTHLMPNERGRWTGVYFHAFFLGNSILSSKSARTQIVLAKLVNPS